MSRDGTVFHVVLWTEGKGTMLSFGIEGPISTREVAERCAAAYREGIRLGYEDVGNPDLAYRSRVGVLEMPVPDYRLGHPVPRDDVEALVQAIHEHFRSAGNS